MTMRGALFLAGVALAAGCAQGTAIQGSYQTCSTCHAAPPPAAPDGTHPCVATDLRYCWACHPGTVDASGKIIPGGLHQDGKVEWTSQGHPDGYASPAAHGRDFFAFVSGADVAPCAGCHGTDYDIPVAGGQSCNSCHAAAGWKGWQGNCSFCHGTKSPATQAGYAVAGHPTWSAPPDAISQRLTGAPVEDRTGAHVIHLTGSAYALPFRCDACHQVPTTVAHISGRNARAALALSAPGQAGPPDTGGWDPGTSTCATACHGAGRSPPWPLRGIACDGCHGVPPATTVHAGLSGSDLTACSGCHPATITAAGVIDVAGGKHVNGTVDRVGGHAAGFAQPSNHGPQYLDFVAGVPGAVNCESCHGTSYGLCNSCHAAAGWVGWQTNCSFCHGVKSPATQAGYVLADHPTWAAPPDAVSQRLTGTPAPDRTGAHGIHLGGSAYALPFRCDVCHQVPTTVAHINGGGARAAVALTAPGEAGPPDPDGWSTITQTCATTCHGAGRSPIWTFTGIACNGCHGVPPATTAHAGVDGSSLTACAGCHPATITAAGVIDVAGGQHVNGRVDVVGGHAAGFAQPSRHGPQYLDFVAGAPGALNCESCHGTTYTLCTSCHSQPASGGWVSWRTNCTFCHGTRTPAWDGTSVTPASPPDAVAERLSGTPVPARTGKHRSHLNGRVGYPGYACATCHAVPASVSHVRVDRRAPVAFDHAAAFTALSAGELAALPSPLAVYDASASPPTCASNYCHGSTLSGGTAAGSPPRWSTAAPGINDCTICHGGPPDTGQLLAADGAYCVSSCSVHVWHVQALPAGCDACHHGSAPVNDARLHVNGRADVVFGPGSTGTWDPGAKTCAMACHSDAAARSWR